MSISTKWFSNKYTALHGTNDLWVAFSGGIDSRVLLELAYQYTKLFSNYKLHAIHINHGLHKNSDDWARHCSDVCKTLGIPLYVLPIKLDIQPGQSLEAIARQARRTIWENLLPANATLLLAHHAQDQAETILYRLFRGAGPTGLSGMAEAKIFGKGILLRPLLNVAKADSDEFAEQNKLIWIVDDSNANIKFDRNFIRHIIIPTLCKRWPKVVDNIRRGGELCAETAELVNADSQALLNNLTGTVAGTLSISKLLAITETQCFTVIRAWLANNNCQMPSRSQLYRIKREVMLANSDVKPMLNFTQYKIRRYRDDLYLLVNEECFKKENFFVAINPPQEILLANGKIIKIKETTGCGFMLPDNSKGIAIYIGSHGEKAKKIFQQHNIPLWQRQKYPLIFYENRLICIVGLWLKPNFITTPGKSGLTMSML